MNDISNFQNLVLAEKRQYLRGEQEQTCLKIFFYVGYHEFKEQLLYR